MKRRLTETLINKFKEYLILEERSTITIEKYMRDIRKFVSYNPKADLTKEKVIDYKNTLQRTYAVRSVNSMLAAINSFFTFLGWDELKVKSVKLQQQIYCQEEKELQKEEYFRLCRAALRQKNQRLNLILQTICSTGIRVSELQYITVETVKRGKVIVMGKSKTRVVFLVETLRKKLLCYVRQMKIQSGVVFVTKKGKPLNRTNIWKEMKALCKDANVNPQKVFPHNLRHLFARVFYDIEKDIAKLADILGHSNINTTRIYIVSTGIEHRRKMEKLRLVL